jgi:LPLT family lysophospholipid transporter-like MFS transporter
LKPETGQQPQADCGAARDTMKKGFSTIMSAQFFSSLADNALLVAAVELLRLSKAPAWQTPALAPMFALFYVILAPFVGAFADSMPKGRVMFISNSIKIIGCLMMLFGSHPLLAYAVVGLGAAAYSPAKYGILTELLPPSQLVKGNAWIEGLTVGSIILGVVLGGLLIGRQLSGLLLGLDLPLVDTAVDTPPEAAIAFIVSIYLIATVFNLYIPRTSAPLQPLSGGVAHFVRDFSRCNSRLWADKLGQISLATTTLLWGVFGNLRLIVFAWAAAALGYATAEASKLVGVVIIGSVAGAVVASMTTRLDRATSVIPLAIVVGVLMIGLNVITNVWVAAPFLVLLGALCGFPHRAHECAAAAPRPQPDGRRPFDRGAELQRTGLHPGPGRPLRGADQAGPVGVRGHRAAGHDGGRGDGSDTPLAPQQRDPSRRRGRAAAGHCTHGWPLSAP